MCLNVFIVNSKMYFVFNILILILVKVLISVESNTTTDPKGVDDQNLRTTSSVTLNNIGINETFDLAVDTTQWYSQRLTTERPTTLYVTQKKTTVSGIGSSQKYSEKTENISDQKVTQTLETSSYVKPVTSPSMAAVYEETSAENVDKTDDMQEHESVTTKSLFSQHSDHSIFMGNEASAGGYDHICDFCLYEGQGNFTSYGYPLHYRNNLNCTYRVMRIDDSNVCEVELYFHEFDIPVSSLPSTAFQSTKNNKENDCREDYLEVNGIKYCGTGWKHHSEVLSFPSTQKELVFRFVSNEKTNGKGFWAEVRRKPNTCYDIRLKTQASEVCEERFLGTEFEILSPHFPDNYPINSDCSYFIGRANEDVCALEFIFFKFDLEYSEGCSYDYLEIDGQKFCGTIPESAQNIFKFESDQKILSFQSDSQVSKPGFHIRVKQITDCRTTSLPAPPSCNVCTSEGFGALVSYSYPDYYRNNLFCTYTIDRRNADYCYVELDFEDFELQNSDNCEADFLQVEDMRYCGDSLKSAKRVIPFDGKEKGVVLLFKTDASKTKRGFLIQYKQLECTNDVVQEKASLPSSAVLPVPHSKCDYVFSEKEFVIKSENFSKSYSNNLECSYYVKRNSTKVCYLELTFIKFDVEASPECQYDYLEVGNTVRLCGTLQTETVRTYTFDTNEKLLKFHSDASNNRNGFLIKAEQLECNGDKIIRKITPSLTTPSASVVSPTHHSLGDSSYCSQVLDDQEFDILSPGYPSPYPTNQDCLHMIRKISPNICKLEVIFDDFEIQPSDPNAYCKYDFLDFNGIRVCGDIIKGESRSYLFPSETFAIHFHSDNSVTSSDKAFRINLRQMECEPNQIPTQEATNKNHYQKNYNCNQVFSEEAFELKSPDYPNNYPDNLNCKYTIVKHSTGVKICQLEVNFVDMNLEKSEDCSRDYLNFNGQLMCGSLSTETTRLYAFESNQFVINFVSDHYGNERGFFLRLRQRECPNEDRNIVVQQPVHNGLAECGGIYNDESFELKSPNYPQYYENNVDCVYTIRRKDNNICKLELMFVDFDVEPSPGCAYDYLMVDGKKLCGDMNPNHIKSLEFHEKEKTLLFRSGTYSVINRRGFLVRAQQKECEIYKPTPQTPLLPPIPSICEICFTEVMGTIQSYDFPNNYPANLNCKYKITALPGNCMVQLNFDKFRLESSDSCDADYLKINNIRYCGNQLEGATLLAFNKKPEEVLIRFVSNSQKSFRGFRASYTQMPCIGGVPSGQQQLTLDQQHQYYSNHLQPQLQRQPQHSTGLKTPPTSPQSVSHYGSVPIAIFDDANSSLIRIPCDQVIYDTVFELRSPNYPAYYPPNNDCLYSIRRANSDVCKLQLRFVYFDVKGDYKECSGDSLEIEGNKICGRLTNNTIKEFPFESYKTSLRFRSDPSFNGKGFEIIGQQIQCTYDLKSPPIKTSSNHSKYFSPPKTPSQYAQSSVQYTNENTLTSSQSQPIPQPHSRPPHSYSSGKSPQTDPSSPYVSPHSSPSIQATPQQHHYYYRSPQPSPQASPSEPYKGKASPSQQTDYNYERVVERHITPSPSLSSAKSYPTQQTSYHSKSQYQYSQQSQRPYSPSQKVDPSPQTQPYRPPQTYFSRPSQIYGSSEVSGSTTQRKHYPKQSQNPNYMEVRHKPEPNYGTQMTNNCDEKIDKMYFEIKSPKEFNSECMYRIEKAKNNVCQLDIMFSNFDLGDQSCLKEYMAVNGQRICGNIDRNTMKTFKFEGNELMIELRTETMSFDNGLDIKARQVECSPPQDIMHQKNFGQSQQNNGNHNKPPKERPFRPEIPSHGIPVHHAQQIGTQENSIREPPPQDFRQKPFSKPIEPIQRFPSNYDRFETRPPQIFGTNDQSAGPTAEERCHLIYNEIEFPIKSPNHPNPYPSNMFCRYTIRKANPNVCAVDMKFNSFDIEDDPKCAKDYLEVDAGRICGPLPPSHERRYYFLPDEYEKVLIFKSDDSGEMSGFSLLVRQIEDCTKPWAPMSAPPHPTVCDVCHHNTRGQISSTNYPNRYSDFTRCSYRIQAMGPQYCNVKLYLRDMDIESSHSGNCMKDALIIDSQKLCGKDPKTKEMTLTFPSSEPREVIINFQTDDRGTGRGFLIEYVQEPCSSNRSPSLGQQPITPFKTNVNPIPSHHSVQQPLPTKPDNRFGTLLPPIYPPNYVSRAHIEEIVQTQVQVFDRNQTQQRKSDIPLIK